MSSLTFPDINLWIAIAAPKHCHHSIAAAWWKHEQSAICFFRQTQLGFLRLTTTAAAMDGKPLTMLEAWEAYDWFYQDERVRFMPEQPGLEDEFRRASASSGIAPKQWADLWMLAFAKAAGGVLVTFDRALTSRGAHCLLGGWEG